MDKDCDAVSFVALLFTATVTPVEVSLLSTIPLVKLVKQPQVCPLHDQPPDRRLLHGGHGLQLFHGLPSRGGGGAACGSELAEARRSDRIVGFFIDLLSDAPSSTSSHHLGSTSTDDTSGAPRRSRHLPLLGPQVASSASSSRAHPPRVARRRAIAKYSVVVSFAQLTMIKFMTVTFFLIHFMACARAYAGLNWIRPDPPPRLAPPRVRYEFATVEPRRQRPTIATGGADALNAAIAPHQPLLHRPYVAVCSMFGSVGSITPSNDARRRSLRS